MAPYDPLMRLYSVAGASTAGFAYDGLNAIQDYDASNVVQHRYVFDPDGQPIVQYDGTGTTSRRFLSADERGSVISLTDSTGALVGTPLSYDEYGRPGAANQGRFQYTGQKWIGEAGLYDYKARDYLPNLGIFAQTDPVGYADTPNLYAYVGDDPVNLADPMGLFAPDDPFGSVCRGGDACKINGIDAGTYFALVQRIEEAGGTVSGAGRYCISGCNVPVQYPSNDQMIVTGEIWVTLPGPDYSLQSALLGPANVSPSLGSGGGGGSSTDTRRSKCAAIAAGAAGYVLGNEAKEAAAVRGFSLFGRMLTGGEFGAEAGGGFLSLEGAVGGAVVGGATYFIDKYLNNAGAKGLHRDYGLCK